MAAYDQVLIFAFYSRQNTKLPVIIGVAAVFVYFLFAFTLVDQIGMMGLVLANSAQFIFHTIVIWWFGRNAFGWSPNPSLRHLIPCIAGSALIASVIAWLAWYNLAWLEEYDYRIPAIGWRLLLVAIPGGLFVITYFTMVIWLAPDVVRQLGALIQGRLPARFQRFSI